MMDLPLFLLPSIDNCISSPPTFGCSLWFTGPVLHFIRDWTPSGILKTIRCLAQIVTPVLEKICDLLADPLARTCNHVLESGRLPPLWIQVVVMALLKDQKDPTSPASYCPISLLNVDFTSLPSRVNSFIANYMDTNQVGFITGR